MRVLVLGAGGIGGYFGGRLVESGADVTFLVRPARAAELATIGLRIRSVRGDADLEVTTIGRHDVGPGYHLVLLTCEAYDLPEAIEAIGPAMTGGCGSMLERCRAHGLDDRIHLLAYVAAKAYEERRAAGRLPLGQGASSGP